MFTVLTYNLWGVFGPSLEERWAYAAGRVAALGADVLCLQEATDARLLAGLAKAAGRRVAASDLETGLAVLTDFPVSDVETVTYRKKSPVEDYVRKYLWMRVETPDGAFHLGDTHLSWQKGDDEAREAQAAELAERARGAGGPVLLAGDFNSEFGSKCLSALAKAGYRDSMEGFPDALKPSWDNRNPYIRAHAVKFDDMRIDLELLSPLFAERYRAEDSRIVLDAPSPEGLFASDHFGVLARYAPRA